MKEHPIIFSAPMVRAILEGRKIQTRRAIKPQPARNAEINCLIGPYQPGDRLWVREGWRIGAWDENAGRVAIDYRADGYCRREWLEISDDDSGDIFNQLWIQSTDDAEKALGVREFYHWKPGKSPCRWRPSIFMPRWAARILLEVVSIRVERLQDISTTDCIAEGMDGSITLTLNLDEPCDNRGISVHEQFYQLWDSINAKHGYGVDKNPWVWVIEFKIIRTEGYARTVGMMGRT